MTTHFAVPANNRRSLNSANRFARATGGRLPLIALLLLLWSRLLLAANMQAVTFDEPIHILQSVLVWQRWPLESVVQNPPLPHLLMGGLLQLLFDAQLPTASPLWGGGDWLALSKTFMWEANANGLQLIWAARLATISLTLLLATLSFRFTRQLSGSRGAALLVLLLVSFDPNVLAHGFLATTDLALAFFLLLAAFGVWRLWSARGGSTRRRTVAGAMAVGLAFGTKFTAVVLVPALLLLVGLRALLLRLPRRIVMRDAGLATLLLCGGAVILLSLYRFQWPVLALDYTVQQAHQTTGHSAYLHGALSTTGWWTYFPLALLLKTPIPTLLALLLALALTLLRGHWRRWEVLWLLLPAGGIFAAGLLSRVNIGYRYLLPMLPLLMVFLGVVAGAVPVRPARRRLALLVLLLPLSVSSLAVHPRYLGFFNLLAGGPRNGWRWLVDSNLDWGQDLVDLAVWERGQPGQAYQVAWLGTAPLPAYGIVHGQPAPIWPTGREDPLSDPYYPPAPSPGRYVISATQLVGAYLQNPARYAWFQDRTPTARVGSALFVYDVPASGPPVSAGISGLGPAMVAPSDYQALFASNDVTWRWFDARGSFLWPAGGTATWVVVGEGHRPNDQLLLRFYGSPRPALTGSLNTNGREWRYQAFAADWDGGIVLQRDFGWSTAPQVSATTWEVARQPLPAPALFDESLALLGYQLDTSRPEAVALLSVWEVVAPLPPDLQLFAHLVDDDGSIVSQHDGLDLTPATLLPGDRFAQLHWLPLAADGTKMPLGLQVGAYRRGDLIRLPVSTGTGTADRVLLSLVLPGS